MNIAVTGSHGLIGSALVARLEAAGHYVTRLARWPYVAADVEGTDAVIHLAGASIAGRWTEARKRAIEESRVLGTRSLAQAIAESARPPAVFISASAIGYYGHRHDETMQEEHDRGDGFLADVCDHWEKATWPARRAHVRVVNLRFGMVLSAQGGALAKMLPPFRLGLGGRIGCGRQYMSWIALEDAVGIIQRALVSKTLDGPVNAVAPYPVTNFEFTERLAQALHVRARFPMPAFLARLIFGEMADELLLASTRVEPIRLIATGYRFQYPLLDGALRHLLEASAPALAEAHA
jgi:uncharacterized protein (TIGR01777 family)